MTGGDSNKITIQKAGSWTVTTSDSESQNLRQQWESQGGDALTTWNLKGSQESESLVFPKK